MTGTDVIVLPGGGYAAHAPHEAEPVASWLGGVSHAVHVFTHGPHGPGLAQGTGEAAIWTTLAEAWIHEQGAP